MNEQLEQLFGKYFNGLHYEDITKEMMMMFAIEYANIKVEDVRQTIRVYHQHEGYELIKINNKNNCIFCGSENINIESDGIWCYSCNKWKSIK